MGDSTAASTLPDVAPSDEGQVANPGTALYGECQKNYLASTGGHATAGCEGFLPLRRDNVDLECARCSCHRNFHRRKEEPGNMLVPSAYIPALPLAWRGPGDVYCQVPEPLPRRDPPVADTAGGADAASACPTTPAKSKPSLPPPA